MTIAGIWCEYPRRSFYNAAVPANMHYVLHGLMINPIDM